MSALRALQRDLIERKLWMLIVPLVLAAVAVPVLMLNGGSAVGAPTTPVPPAAASPVSSMVTATKTAAAPKAPAKVAYVKPKRDPFATGEHATTTASTSTTATSAASPSAQATATSASNATSATTTATAMVSPAPASTSQSSAPAASSTATSSSVSSTPVSTTASVTPAPVAAKVQSWTVYSVSVRYGKNTSVPLRSNVARLTPFPAAANPEAMFLGVMTGGKQAVFALPAGVGHTGPGLCRPDHSRCSAILLKAGQTEHLTIPVTGGTPKQVILRLVRVTRHITHSHKVALAAYLRYSAAGLCDLALADPVLYDLGTGTVSGMPKAVCRHQSKSVPFTPLMATP